MADKEPHKKQYIAFLITNNNSRAFPYMTTKITNKLT